MNKQKTFALCVALLCGLVVAGGVLAMPTASYDLSRWTVDGGGGALSIDGGYSLSSTAGQPEVGLLTDGGYTLSGGFWGGGALAEEIYRVYLPLVISQSP
jgi:hypothetical protein